MAKQVISPAGIHKTGAYSHAIKKAGTPVFIAGQVALDAQGELIGAGDAAAQAEQVLTNLRAVVEACGGTLADIVKLTVYTTDLAHRAAIGAARQRHFSEPFPASTFLVIASLADPRFLLEIEAVAMLD